MIPKEKARIKEQEKMEKGQAQVAVTVFVTTVARKKAIRPQIAGVRKEIRAKETKRAITRARNMYQG